jgi:glyoxylase-like metal-dependent hydrolase (beta-lactamase superfamily II)
MSNIEIRTFVAPGFAENAYLVWHPGSASAVAVDPGGDASAMADMLSSEGLWLEAILLTHAHLDHIEGVARLVRRTGAAIYLHPADAPLYQRAGVQALQFGMHMDEPPPVDHPLHHGQVLQAGGLTFQVRHVPGHSPGHVILYVEDAGSAFVGDVIFQNSVGRTDLPGGSFPQLIQGIRSQVFTLPDETTLYPGHGPATTVSHERATNPFLVPQFGGGLA